MNHITVTRTIDLPRDAVWTILADFPNIGSWSSGVKTSKATTKATSGVGAERYCDFNGPGDVKERITSWEEGKGYFVDFTAISGPIKNAGAGFRLRDGPAGKTEVEWEIRYDTKMGPLGTVMNALMMKRQFRKNGAGVLADLEAAARKVASDPTKN